MVASLRIGRIASSVCRRHGLTLSDTTLILVLTASA
jgi:hypothetical protein